MGLRRRDALVSAPWRSFHSTSMQHLIFSFARASWAAFGRGRNPAGSRALWALLLLGSAPSAALTAAETLASLNALKKLSLEELMNLEVTSVSKRPEKLSETASAVQGNRNEMERSVHGRVVWRF